MVKKNLSVFIILVSIIITILVLYTIERLMNEDNLSEIPVIKSKSSEVNSTDTLHGIPIPRSTVQIQNRDQSLKPSNSILNTSPSLQRAAPVTALHQLSDLNKGTKSTQLVAQPSIIRKNKKHSTHLSMLATCPAEVAEAYNTPQASAGGASDVAWCKKSAAEHHVQVGRSWGSLPRHMIDVWESRRCNEIVASGDIQACDAKWGWGMFDSWIRNKKAIISGHSTATCAVNAVTSTYCRLTDVVVDFSKARVNGITREFSTGFLTTYGDQVSPLAVAPGHTHVTVPIGQKADMQCDVMESRPTFFISHDDIFNLGHHINDVVAVWSMAVLAGRSTADNLLVNMDGLREGGPAGGPKHRMMVATDPDAWGPYIGFYKSWFGDMKRAAEYRQMRVCYSEVYFQPYPGIGWFWNNWGHVDECSKQGPSPLYQSFSLFMRQRWEEEHGSGSLPSPPTDRVLVVIEARSINKKKTNNHSVARHIVNLDALVAELRTIPGVEVRAQDFATLAFKDQVALAHSAGVILSMHGAGTTHLFHMAVGRPNCCALVELQPDKSIGFQSAVGFGNLARMHGLHYFRYDAADGLTGPTGTTVNVEAIRGLVEQAVRAVTTKPTCLQQAKDTTTPVYSNPLSAP